MRWTQFGCFSPIMQMHRQVTTERQYPWRYGDAALANYQFFAELHTRLFPYIYTYAKEASATGLPIIRPLVLANQTDANTFGLNHTYQFGNEFLVAPMITPNSNTRQVYLPAGNWFDFWTNARHTGAQNITWTNSNQAQFPLFVREGAIVPMLLAQDVQTLCDSNYINNAAIKSPDSGILFLVYPGGSSRFTMYDGTDVQCAAAAGKTTVTVTSGARQILLQILGDAPASVTRDGNVLPEVVTAAHLDSANTAWRFDASKRLILVKFQHAGATSTIQISA
jgi:alpha-glucosidase (family GH31 glycosyl hydrolase)